MYLVLLYAGTAVVSSWLGYVPFDPCVQVRDNMMQDIADVYDEMADIGLIDRHISARENWSVICVAKRPG